MLADGAPSSTAGSPGDQAEHVEATTVAPVPEGAGLAFISYLRIIAMVGVVFIHVSGLTTTNVSLRGTSVWWIAQLMKQGSRWCVPLFVVISGALLLQPRAMAAGPGVFYRRRLSRLVPALVVWHLVYIAFVEVVLGRRLTFRQVLADLLLGRTYTALYFFWLILGLYLAAPLLYRVVADRSRREQLMIGFGVVAATCVWATLVTVLIRLGVRGVAPTFTIATYWLPYVGYFLLGAGLVRVRPSARWAWVASAGFVLLTLEILWQATSRRWTWLPNLVAAPSYYTWTVAASTVALFVAAAWWIRPGTRWAQPPWSRRARFLGDLTLGVFALHLLVLYGLQHGPFFSLGHGADTVVELVYLTVATLVLSFSVAALFHRIPGLRRLV